MQGILDLLSVVGKIVNDSIEPVSQVPEMAGKWFEERFGSVIDRYVEASIIPKASIGPLLEPVIPKPKAPPVGFGLVTLVPPVTTSTLAP